MEPGQMSLAGRGRGEPWDQGVYWLISWSNLLVAGSLAVAGCAAVHAVMYKRDPRSALGWLAAIWLAPFLGALAYFAFGINRVRRRAVRLRPPPRHPELEDHLSPCAESTILPALQAVAGRVTGLDLLRGNAVEPLVGGEAAFSAMVAGIERARRSVILCTYIFDVGAWGSRFVAALADAVRRGVEVRVLVDDVGARYTFPSVLRRLRRLDVPVARFARTLLPWRFRYVNLRNHRKVLVVDGEVVFTGGMNIREATAFPSDDPRAIRDLHFRVTGPVVGQFLDAVSVDWAYCTGETLAGDAWHVTPDEVGCVAARVVADGPDEDFDKLRLTLLGAITAARRSIQIVTPYYLPDVSIIVALGVAALRGVDVDLVIPRDGNLRLVRWATMAQLWQILERGCRVWLTPPPFDHTKLMVVDREWSFIGSANWDARSLRLNFELNVECYDERLAAELGDLVDTRREAATPLTLEAVDGRSIPARIRDGVARLFTPYL